MSRCKFWCFTVNSGVEETDARLSQLEVDDDECPISYILFGREIAPTTGRPHLQGFVAFRERKRLSQARALIGEAHMEPARRIDKAMTYCKKEGDCVELGEPPVKNQGARNDLEAVKLACRSGSVKCAKDIRWKHSEMFAKYPNFCQQLLNDVHEEAIDDMVLHPLRVWQAEMYQYLQKPPSNREIVFVVDPVGNSGKSWFAQYCERMLPDGNVQIQQPGKKDNMSYDLNQSIRIYFLDAPRSKNGDFIQYDYLEHLKDRRVFSPKYESKTKRLNMLHVVVLMNEEPNMCSLSNDRYKIVRLTPASLECAAVEEVDVPVEASVINE